jgi:hypothetical protein
MLYSTHAKQQNGYKQLLGKDVKGGYFKALSQCLPVRTKESHEHLRRAHLAGFPLLIWTRE